MCQLVRKQPAFLRRVNAVLPLCKSYVLPDSIGPSMYGPRGSRRSGISMYTHVAEVATEPSLHEVACGIFERLPG